MVGGMEDLARLLVERLGRPPCGVALDIDGTLTVTRRMGVFRVHLGAVEAMRRLEDAGIATMLVTGNSAPVVAGLSRYLGSGGPHVAENGCVVYWRGRVWSVCRYTARAAARVIEEEMGGVLRPSWQNSCRLHDYAFTVVDRSRDPSDYIEAVAVLLRERGLRAKLSSSGYALHVRPPDASKGEGIAVAARLAGLDTGCIVAVGDSEMDAEMREHRGAALLAAVGNAEKGLREKADIVLPGRSGESAKLLLEAVLLAQRLAR